MSVAAAIEAGAARLAAAGCDDARHEAGLLWAGLRGQSVGAVWLERDVAAPEEHVERFVRAIERRATGEPLAYIVGNAGFRTLELGVDARVLIPRPETEGIVGLVIEHARRRFGPHGWGGAADIGTGSGCIALSLAVEGAFERIVATDVSADALLVARENLRRVAPPTPVELRCGDLLTPLAGEQFAVIVSNPPYIAHREIEALPDGVRRYEPHGALLSGDDGLQHTWRLLDGAGDALIDGGLLAVEVDSRRADRVRAMARRAGWPAGRVHQDLFGRSRYYLTTKE